MKTKPLADILERVESWPPHLQDELAAFARELDAGADGRDYQPTPEQLVGIDRGLRDAAEGRFASDAEVEAAFAKFRGR
jgi:hypothetical protein